MKWSIRIVVAITVVLLAMGAMAQDVDRATGKATLGTETQAAPRPQPDWVVPESSVSRPEDAGVRMHTTMVFRSLDGSSKPTHLSSPAEIPNFGPLTTDQVEQTPQSLGCLYVGSPKSTGCIPNYGKSKGPSKGGSGAIALVDAFDDPTAATDLAIFDKYWGLTAANFTKIQMTNSCSSPPPNKGWAGEETLDIEYAHVYAPNAAIILVEACSSSYSDLFAAETAAFQYIAANYGYGEVSNSWAGGEFSGQISYDPDFSSWGNGVPFNPITAFASADDAGCGAAYPSTNPWVISAGGTSIYSNSSNQSFSSEGCWSGSGGGISAQETWANGFTNGNTGPWADYQYPIFGEGNRATPDFASNSDPNSGVALYGSYAFGGWSCCWGGTSEASPSLAAIVNRAGNFLGNCYVYSISGTCFFNNQENTLLYSQLPTAKAYAQNFYSPTSGSNGCKVAYGWNYCTGVGSPRGILGK
jgi:subtilase family serine protease